MAKSEKPDREPLLPRDRGGGIDLKGGTGGIVSMCSCDGFLEIYKEDVTFRLEAPENIDPDRTNPNARFVAAITDRVGTSSPILARILLQNRDILQSASFSVPVDKDAVVRILHGIKEAVVACWKAAESVQHHVETIELEIAARGVQRSSAGDVPSLPQVADLDLHVTQFLISAKRAIKGICDLVPLFVKVERSDSDFDHLARHLKASIGDGDPLTEFVEAQADAVRYLISLRNAQEHPKPDHMAHILNFRIQPDGALKEPVWYVTGQQPRAIARDMTSAVDYLVSIAEGVFMHLVDRSLDVRFPFIFREIDEAATNPKNPIRFVLTIDIGGSKGSSD